MHQKFISILHIHVSYLALNEQSLLYYTQSNKHSSFAPNLFGAQNSFTSLKKA